MQQFFFINSVHQYGSLYVEGAMSEIQSRDTNGKPVCINKN